MSIKSSQHIPTEPSETLPEITGLLVESRKSRLSLDKTTQPVEDERPLTIKQILEDKIKPAKEEYDKLKNLDLRKNVSEFSTNIAKGYCNFKLPDGTVKSLNRYIITIHIES